MRKHLIAILFATLTLSTLVATEYFVSKNGDDANPGASKDKAFLTIQKGVDALKPGDVLTIGPGEYFESVRREGLGNKSAETVIRAEIPGTVLLRGDVPVGGFKPVPGKRFVYVSEQKLPAPPQMIKETDTMTLFTCMPDANEPEFVPGTFYYDVENGKLYLSTSDGRPPKNHQYTACVIPAHGLYLSHPVRVVVEGLTATGFYAAKEMPRHDFTLASTWAIFIRDGKKCVIRDCVAYMNAQGIGLNSHEETSGDNVIEHCEAWANESQYGVGDRGGLTLVQPKRDAIRDSLAYLNGHYGINMRTGVVSSKEMKNYSVMEDNVAWGNGFCDFKIKSGGVHETIRCAGGHPSNKYEPKHCLFEGGRKYETKGNIFLDREENVVMTNEFVDPTNHDYRLQATSRFRGTAPGGSDRGPHQYKPDVFFVDSTTGGDDNDGLSTKNAWKTLQRAVKNLKAGDTLYLCGGAYKGGVEFNAAGTSDAPVSIRGRGTTPSIVTGTLTVSGGGNVEFLRICFANEVELDGVKGIRFEQCRFNGSGLKANNVDDLAVDHSLFSGVSDAALQLTHCEEIDLRGNLFENQTIPAVALDAASGVTYADYNGYVNAAKAWSVDGTTFPLTKFKKNLDQHSKAVPAKFTVENGVPVVTNPEVTVVGDVNANPFGPFRHEEPDHQPKLSSPPRVHSASATTANVEWSTTAPATCEIAWGETPKCENSGEIDVNHFGTYSLTGLKPGTTYHFKVKSIRKPEGVLATLGYGPTTEIVKTAPKIDASTSFTTLKANSAPVTYHVAMNGDDDNDGKSRKSAFRTIQRAANTVNVGDSVVISEGTYPERIRIRATGAKSAPITFKCAPGERVSITGADKKLGQNFVVSGKSLLRFDGFYFKDTNREPLGGWGPEVCGEFNLYDCRDIVISRCFSDGRGGYSARFITAWFVDGLLVKNCVIMNKMSGALSIWRCPNVVLENNVFSRQLISAFCLNNTADQTFTLNNNIITDMLKKKAKSNISFAEVEDVKALKLDNNCFVLRMFPPAERIIFCDVDHALHKVTDRYTMGQFDEAFGDTKTLFANPKFAGDPDPNAESFLGDRMNHPNLEIDFNSFFATNPEVVKRGMGVQPKAFKEFTFNNKTKDEEKTKK